MERQYTISGMTCGGCVAKVKRTLEAIPGLRSAQVKLDRPEGVLELNRDIKVDELQERLSTVGHYTISELPTQEKPIIEEHLPEKSFSTYRPLLLIVSFILGVSLLAQYPFEDFSAMLWMRHFMAGFFIVFAFFKLLNIKGFASSYRMYDIIAARWMAWGYIYPFVELALGLSYLLNIAPLATNIATVFILGISSIGVIKSNLDKRAIKCACLGDIFNLPMSTVTIVEDLSMIAMAAGMLYML